MKDVPSEPGRAPSATPSTSAAGLADDGPAVAAFDRVLREADYRERLSREACDLLRLGSLLDGGAIRGDVSRRFCLRLAEEADRVESGLREVGARGNRTYALFAELVHGVRWAARAIHALLHLRGRIRRYLGDRGDLASFRTELDACIAWLGERLGALVAALRAEASGPLALTCPTAPFDPGLLEREEARWRLPQDLHGAPSADERERIAEVASGVVTLADELDKLPRVPEDRAELREYARATFPAQSAEQAQLAMHAVQSAYDTAVAATPLEASDPELKVVRGYVSILLHLLEAVACLLHWNERTDGDGRSAHVRERMETLVDAEDLRRFALAFGLANTALCASEARATAQAVIERYTRRRDVALALPPGRKLHLRPAGLIVRIVQHHGLPVTMRMGEQDVDARQLMDVILLAASHPNETHVRFRGDEKPIADLQALFEHRLGEEGLDGFPASLAYLREASRPRP